MNIIETGLNAIRLPGVTNVLDEYKDLNVSHLFAIIPGALSKLNKGQSWLGLVKIS